MCESFAATNCDEQFSEIFQHNVFSDFSIQEQKVIFSKYSSGAFCINCQINVEAFSEVLINYISLDDLFHLNLLPENWPEGISRSNSCSTSTVQCRNCDNFCPNVYFTYLIHPCLSLFLFSCGLFISAFHFKSSHGNKILGHVFGTLSMYCYSYRYNWLCYIRIAIENICQSKFLF